MNYRELIERLTPLHGIREAQAIVRMVAEERFGLSLTDLLLGKGTDLSANDRKEWEEIAHRLVKGEPVQYVLSYANFCGHRFRVTPDVLIPRPETEELVQRAKDYLLSSAIYYHSSTNVLDLCTGSGCIAISLASACPSAHVLGVDISPAALSVARFNAEALGAENVRFEMADILCPDYRYYLMQEGRKFDLLIANPPYVRLSEAAEMSSTVLEHEPHLALFVPDDDPLRFYKALAAIGRQVLVKGGFVQVELNRSLAEETLRLFVHYGFVHTEIHADSFGNDRMLNAVNP